MKSVLEYPIKYQFYILSFVAGFVLMSIEILASRIVAPFVGTSLYTWTSLIGIILLALSLGNITGGWLADITTNKKTLSYLLLFCGLSIGIIPIAGKIASATLPSDSSLIFNALFASIALFFIPSFLLGAIFPFLLKLSTDDLSNVGRTGGALYGLSSLGSITGTFFTGFIFIGYFGTNQTLFALSILMIAFGLMQIPLSKKILFFVFIAILLVSPLTKDAIEPIKKNDFDAANQKIIYKKESAYYGIKVIEDKKFAGGARLLFLNEGLHSLEPLDSPDLIASYNIINERILEQVSSDYKKILVIGGGSYSFPKYLKTGYPTAQIEVIEIDPEVTKTAEKFFGLDSGQIKTITTDARLFFKNKKNGNYDIIINDAYNNTISVPWHLTTQEFLQDINENLDKNGFYIANFNSGLGEKENGFLKNYYKTVKSVLPSTYILKTFPLDIGEDVQNIVLTAFKNEVADGFLDNFELYLVDEKFVDTGDIAIFTDNFAPVERLMAPSINKYYKYYLDNIYFRFML